MKIRYLTALLTAMSLSSIAQAELPPLSQKELLSRFRIEMKTFYLDGAGKKLLQGPEEKTYGCHANQKLIFDCDFPLDSSRHLVSHWTIKEGNIQAQVSENLGNQSLKQETFELQNFGTFSWITNDQKGNPVTVRFLPTLQEEDPIQPYPAKDKVFQSPHLSIIDQNAEVWAHGIGFAGRYIRLITPKGTLMLSYYSFKGSQKVGSVQDQTIKVQFPNLQLLLLSTTPFFSDGGTADLFGIYMPTQKTEGHRIQMIVSSDEEKFLRN